ncbi:phospholipid scramblase 2-like [Seriola lalandi dorsalis]|uniref:phospholipid scramblase 2-like n=2 Tax=Seriola lalandi dorsalis TaxID=1841481 RepID=UPI000C6F4AA0|nr:phospholipid scramblase 2-like [Seriola lalandi dorsalis]
MKIDQILIHQKVELLEAFIGFETNNQYEIKNSLGQKIYKAKEKNDCCTRNCCGSLRSFDMKIKDNMDREVIRLIRPFRCVSCWCPCCLQEVCLCVLERRNLLGPSENPSASLAQVWRRLSFLLGLVLL